jgi:hypothetical protein
VEQSLACQRFICNIILMCLDFFIQVNAASENLTLIGSELWQLQCLVSGLVGFA